MPKRVEKKLEFSIASESEEMLQGLIIKILRIARSKTQQEVADHLQISRSSVCDIERRGCVHTSQLFSLAELFEVDVNLFNPRTNDVNRLLP